MLSKLSLPSSRREAVERSLIHYYSLILRGHHNFEGFVDDIVGAIHFCLCKSLQRLRLVIEVRGRTNPLLGIYPEVVL